MSLSQDLFTQLLRSEPTLTTTWKARFARCLATLEEGDLRTWLQGLPLEKHLSVLLKWKMGQYTTLWEDFPLETILRIIHQGESVPEPSRRRRPRGNR